MNEVTSAAARRSLALLATTLPSDAWLDELRARGALPAFTDARAALDGRVEHYHDVLPEIPGRQAGYYHDFFCPDHAVQLVFDPRDGHRHACPLDGAIFSGEPYDSAWGWSVNDALSDAALRTAVRRSLGHAPERAAADFDLVRRVLLGYAARYRTLPRAPKEHPGGYDGIACWSALDESVWVIRMAWAAALVRDALAERAQRQLREGLFEPALAHLLRVRYRQIQNVGNWDRAAILTMGLLLDDEVAVAEALDGEYGIHDQLARGVTADGLWWELSLSYHFYVLGALAWTIRAHRATGRPFAAEPMLRGMFAAPIDLAFPDGSLPATNDCWYHIGLGGEVGHGIPDADGFYEMAYGWFGDPAFAWVLAQNRRAGWPRAAFEALLDGSPDVPVAERPAADSRCFAASGLAMLRAGSGAGATAVLLKASPDDGDAHGHPDQLGIALFAGGRRIAIDPGTPGYGIRLNGTWYRQSAAHSTVLLDSRSQPPGAARIGAFEVEPGGGTTIEAEIAWPAAARWPEVAARAQAIDWPDRDPSAGYSGATMHRRLRLVDGVLEDRFEVQCPGTRTIDWLLHSTGEADAEMEPAEGTLAGACGYDELRDARRIAGRPAAVTFRVGDAVVVVRPELEASDELFVASAPGNPAADRHPVLVWRRSAAATTFVCRIEVR